MNRVVQPCIHVDEAKPPKVLPDVSTSEQAMARITSSQKQIWLLAIGISRMSNGVTQPSSGVIAVFRNDCALTIHNMRYTPQIITIDIKHLPGAAVITNQYRSGTIIIATKIQLFTASHLMGILLSNYYH